MKKFIWVFLFVLTLLSGCTTIRKAIDDLIEGKVPEKHDRLAFRQAERSMPRG